MAASHYIVLGDGHFQEHPTQNKGKFSIVLQCLIGDILASSAIITLPVQILMGYILTVGVLLSIPPTLCFIQ